MSPPGRPKGEYRSAQRDPLYRDVATTVIESSRDEIARFSRELEAVLPDPLRA